MHAIRKLIPRPLKACLAAVRQILFYQNYNSSAYWRKRASESEQAAVLWRNQEYNNLYRSDQRRIIEPWVGALPSGATVLDIGCGIGIVAAMIGSVRPDIEIDAVDFEEMVAIARERTKGLKIRYIASSAEDFDGNGARYDLIISSACYSAIRNIAHLKNSLDNGARMLKPGGTILMIDPFHRWNLLARAKFATRDVVAHLKPHGLRLVEKSGVIFWPYRIRYANSDLRGAELAERYHRGERLLKQMGQHLWADYKVLAFRKQP
jgi:ubiquinone/menaquinone biosynthesis C-methylase UbiE